MKRLVISISILLAVFFILAQSFAGPKKRGLDVFKDETVWVKCRNPECKHEYQMNKKEYFEYMQKHGDPASRLPPALVCPKCKKESGFRAVKCAKCELVFERGSVPATFSDQCPNCGYSKTKEDRKKVAVRRAKVGTKSVAVDANSPADPNVINVIKDSISQFEGLEKALEGVNNGSRREMNEWVRGALENRTNLAKAVQAQATAELNFIRELAVEEGALKTTAAIDGLLADRQERFGKMLEKIKAEVKRMRRGEREDRRVRGRYRDRDLNRDRGREDRRSRRRPSRRGQREQDDSTD